MTTAISVCGINRPLGRSATILAPTYRFCASSDPMEPLIISDVGIIVMPGGGYNELIDKDEQTPVAEYFAQKFGITTFVLYYRLVQTNGTYRYPVPMWDAQRAVRFVRANAAEYGISPEHIGVFGFSAGGHLASTIAIHFDTSFGLPVEDGLDSTDARPDFMGLGYPVISMDPNQYARRKTHCGTCSAATKERN